MTVSPRSTPSETGSGPVSLPVANRSIIVAVPLGNTEPAALLRRLHARGIACSARDGNLRLAVHLYNHEDDIDQIVSALTEF